MDFIEGISVFKVLTPYFVEDFQIKRSSVENPHLKNDKDILVALRNQNQNGIGFPEIVDLNQTKFNLQEVWTKPLGPSLSNLMQSNPKAIDEASAYFIVTQLINRLE